MSKVLLCLASSRDDDFPCGRPRRSRRRRSRRRRIRTLRHSSSSSRRNGSNNKYTNIKQNSGDTGIRMQGCIRVCSKHDSGLKDIVLVTSGLDKEIHAPHRGTISGTKKTTPEEKAREQEPRLLVYG